MKINFIYDSLAQNLSTLHRFMTFLPQMLLWLMAFYDVVAQKIVVFSEYCLISQNF
jgi:hypothetical protein